MSFNNSRTVWTEPDVAVRVRTSVVQIQGSEPSIRTIVPIPATDRHNTQEKCNLKFGYPVADESSDFVDQTRYIFEPSHIDVLHLIRDEYILSEHFMLDIKIAKIRLFKILFAGCDHHSLHHGDVRPYLMRDSEFFVPWIIAKHHPKIHFQVSDLFLQQEISSVHS